MKNVAVHVVVLGATAVSTFGLPINPLIRWTVSTDRGTIWTDSATVNAAGSVLVRAQAIWEESGTGLVGLGLGLCDFDCTLMGITASDNALNISKHLVPVADTQTLVFTRFAGGIGKIDVDTDTALPAAGLGWCETGQTIPQDLTRPFDGSNPVTLITYQFDISGPDHVVSLGAILKSGTNQALRIYLTPQGQTSGGGQFTRANVPVYGAELALVTPAPSSLALLGIGGLAAARRRR